MTNAEAFLDKYKELEVIAVNEYCLKEDGTAVSKLMNMPHFRSIRAQLYYCRVVRNLLQHNPQIDGEYAVLPSDKMIGLLESVIEQIKNPQHCRDIAITAILWKTMNDCALPVMKAMKEHVYTHVPILADGKVIGVFSENTLFSYLMDNEIMALENDLKISEFAKYLPLDKHESETFAFARMDDLVFEVEEMFEKAFNKKQRLGMVFLTQNGRSTERLLGILTAWDILGH